MSDPYIGEVKIFPYNFVPLGWLMCLGQTVSLKQYRALYAVIGQTYGGDGENFKLPNLSGKAAMGLGQGPGLSQRFLGQTVGSTEVKLTVDQMPSHNHTMRAEISQELNTSPEEMYPGATKAVNGTNINYYKGSASGNSSFSSSMVLPSGNSESHPNQQPVMNLVFCIATDGEFPIYPN